MTGPGCAPAIVTGLLLYVVSFFSLHAIAHCQADDVELPSLVELQSRCAPDVTHRRALLEVEGDAGVWLAEPVAACMVGRLRLLPELRKLVTTMELRIRRTDAHVAILTRQLHLSHAIEDELEDALDRSEKMRERSDRWTRRPALWWAVGVISAVALQVAAVATIGAI